MFADPFIYRFFLEGGELTSFILPNHSSKASLSVFVIFLQSRVYEGTEEKCLLILRNIGLSRNQKLKNMFLKSTPFEIRYFFLRL